MRGIKNKLAQSVAVVVGAAALAAGVLMSAVPASAQWGPYPYHHHRSPDVGAAVAAGAITGLAAGAIAAGAAGAPVYGADCYVQRQRVWDGYGWRVQRVQVCD